MWERWFRKTHGIIVGWTIVGAYITIYREFVPIPILFQAQRSTFHPRHGSWVEGVPGTSKFTPAELGTLPLVPRFDAFKLLENTMENTKGQWESSQIWLQIKPLWNHQPVVNLVVAKTWLQVAQTLPGLGVRIWPPSAFVYIPSSRFLIGPHSTT